MFSVIEHIEYLISEHDCVVVPGLGAFIAQYTHATIDMENGTILPPKRIVSYNSAVCHNDGLLANSIEKREGVGYDAALKAIEAAVNSIKSELNAGNPVAFGAIGELSLNTDGSAPVFSQSIKNSRNDYFGLTFCAIPKESVMETDESERNNVASLRYRALRIAASVVVLLVMSLFLTTPVAFDEASKYQTASIGTIIEKEHKQFNENTETEKELYISIPQINEGMAIADTSTEETILVEEPKKADNATNVESKIDPSAEYFLIVASLPTMNDAERFITDKNDNLGVLEINGRYRVYAASDDNLEQLKSIKKSVSARYPDAWICRK